MTAEREQARGEAADWHILLHDTPEDETLRADFRAWLERSDQHRAAWDALGTTEESRHVNLLYNKGRPFGKSESYGYGRT